MEVLFILAVLFLGETTSQFSPGCSFFSGQCVYNVKLGHEQSCDVAGTSGHSPSSSSQLDVSGGCSCGDVRQIENDVSSLKNTVSDIQTAVNNLYHEMNISKSKLAETQTSLHGEQQTASSLLSSLQSKEQMLNKTKTELANVLTAAKTEIDQLRSQLVSATKKLSTCQANAGLPTTTPAVFGGYSTFYCSFESSHLCNFTAEGTRSSASSHQQWIRYSHKISSSTGPDMDHTYETNRGHYMSIDTQYLAEHYSSSTIQNFLLTSQTFEPASHYCVRFWYSTHGADVKPIKVYAKVNGGLGNPISTINPVNTSSAQWMLGEIEIGDEYTSNRFQVVFEASTNAHYTYTYHSGYSHSTKNYYGRYGSVALDDVYIYNTSCSDVPLCPINSYTHKNVDNTTSCYTFHSTPMAWYDAINECKKQSYNGHLAAVNSPLEHRYLVSVIQANIDLMVAGQKGYYISGNDENSEGHFVWTNGGSPTAISYENWYPGQPNNVGSDQDCILMQYPDSDYQWGDVQCAEKHPFICEATHG